jgi:hypothetical protein
MPGAGCEDGRGVYEVERVQGDTEHEIHVAQDGPLLEPKGD